MDAEARDTEAELTGWRRPVGRASLAEVHRSVPVRASWSPLRKLLAFFGPGYLVAVGYMDPGNWATSLAGGSAFGYTLLSVVVLSSLMAMVLQALSLKLGIASGRDLAQACRDHYSRPAGIALWFLCEIAIVACDLAEVIGTAIALNLLFGLPLLLGRRADRRRRAPDPGPAGARLPLARGVHHRARGGDLPLLRLRDGAVGARARAACSAASCRARRS